MGDSNNTAIPENRIRLIKRTKILLIVIGFAGLILCLAGPRLVEHLMNRRSPFLKGAPRYWGMLLGGFACALLLVRALYLLYSLLRRAERGRVLTHGGLHALDGLTGCCLLAGIITGLIGLTCLLSFLAISMAALLSALFLRVMRHVFAAAVDTLEKTDHHF